MCDRPSFLPSGFSIIDIYAAMFTRWRGSICKDWLAEGQIPKLKDSQQSFRSGLLSRRFGIGIVEFNASVPCRSSVKLERPS